MGYTFFDDIQGKTQLASLANRLTMEYGNGYTLTNLKYMRQFYLAFPIGHALRDELSWTHYLIFMRVADEKARILYMNECVACSWGTRIGKYRNFPHVREFLCC